MTQEEIKAAVLAECERLCPDLETEWTDGRFRITRLMKQYFELQVRMYAGPWVPFATINANTDPSFEHNKYPLDMFCLALGLDKRPAVIDLSPIKDELETVNQSFYLKSDGAAFAWNRITDYLYKLESGLKPSADTKWERLKAKIESSRVWFEKQKSKDGLDWGETDRMLTAAAEIMGQIEKGEL